MDGRTSARITHGLSSGQVQTELPVIWLTGLPASGKSTVATLVARELQARGFETRVLDGDVLRATAWQDLGFSREDRDEQVARTARLAAETALRGTVVIVALVSPYRAARDAARSVVGPRFCEVYVRASVAACIRRDPKGMYRRAISGTLEHFTGISDPYEPPLHPELVLDTECEPPEVSVARVVALIGRTP